MTYDELIERVLCVDRSSDGKAILALRSRIAGRLILDEEDLSTDLGLHYSSAYGIEISTDACCVPAVLHRADFMLTVLVSASKNLFTFVRWMRKPIPSRNTTAFVVVTESDAFPGCLEKWRQVVEDVLASSGYVLVQGDLLKEVVEDRLTELDGIPANVFQVLFSEMY